MSTHSDDPELDPADATLPENLSRRMDDSIAIPGSGLLYRFSMDGQNDMANEIGQAYARRQALDSGRLRRRTPDLETILNILGILGSSMDTASAALAMPTPTENRVTHRITFKNDADIILIPGQINMPWGYFFNSGTTILFPGETCTCVETHEQARHDVDQRMSFAFCAISTDERFLPADTDPAQADVFPFEVWIGRSANRTTLTRVEGYVGNYNVIYPMTTEARNVRNQSRLQYIGFRGREGSSMPSFGIACVDVTTAIRTREVMATQITFTPLDLRS